jgi:hypothetical protein
MIPEDRQKIVLGLPQNKMEAGSQPSSDLMAMIRQPADPSQQMRSPDTPGTQVGLRHLGEKRRAFSRPGQEQNEPIARQVQDL